MVNSFSNKNVHHPKEFLEKEANGIKGFNNSLAVKITNIVGSMWSAYLFALLSFMSLPAIITQLDHNLVGFFPSWIITGSMITLIAWISQNFLQLVLLPIILVGQNVIQGQQDAKAEADHQTLTYLANNVEAQLETLKKITSDLEEIKKKI